MKLRIRDVREDSDLSQRKVAEYLGVRQQTYSRYELGEIEPSLESLAKLAALYHTSVDFLIGMTDKKEPYSRSALFTTDYPEGDVSGGEKE